MLRSSRKVRLFREVQGDEDKAGEWTLSATRYKYSVGYAAPLPALPLEGGGFGWGGNGGARYSLPTKNVTGGSAYGNR
jgi:hypothetical protein